MKLRTIVPTLLLSTPSAYSMSTLLRAPATTRAAPVRTSSDFLSATIDDDGDLLRLAEGMVERTGGNVPLTRDELDDCVNSMKNVLPGDGEYDWAKISSVLSEVCHVSHKDWEVTEANSLRLNAACSGETNVPFIASPGGKQMMERVFDEGNSAGAARQSEAAKSTDPTWTVLVTGVNGIRKTTSMYQPWFSQLLGEALVAPPGAAESYPSEKLPTGRNSFFRQLDHIIATACNQHFRGLYRATEKAMEKEGVESPSKDIVQAYSTYKAGIFSRYRTLSELYGVLLVRFAQTQKWNVLLETSGKDVAMFKYIDHMCRKGSPVPDTNRKLALHFEINELDLAKGSVDARMIREIRSGIRAKTAREGIYANAGGPYGSDVLDGVQQGSDKVWHEQVMGANAQVGSDWYKATIRIQAHPERPWTARAVRADGSLGTEFTFEDPRAASK